MGRLKLVVINLVVLAGLLSLAEGAASFASFYRHYARGSDLAERRHTEYDPLLGYVNLPHANVPNMYGAGRSLTTNGQRFRNDHDFTPGVPAGRVRVICSGDSFTIGYGVGDADPWCRQLEALDPRLETVNMGQGGYGIDQAYLWYQRDAAALKHNAQLFAFITPDIQRAIEPGEGYKPFLTVENGAIVAKNVPVPVSRRLQRELPRLHTVGALHEIALRLGFAEPGAQLQPWLEGQDAARRLVTAILTDLKKINDERSSKLILVHLPIEGELRARQTDPWVEFIDGEARRLGVPMVTLIDAFDALPPRDAAAMFIKEGEIDYPGSAGHYTAAGNRFVAGLIYERIKALLPLNPS
ncbi:MAG: hypothetical protein K2Y23_05680 [Cyanobacteria bacterium]|nr:hypothetical protein [Cyanobacteriota bacterium]